MKYAFASLSAACAAAILSLLPQQASAQSASIPVRNTVSLNIGYINKDWVTEADGETYHENFWGEPDKRLHGLQLGIGYQPTLMCGLGLDTGLAFEFCTSSSDFVKEKGWDSYNEFSLYLPLHLAWRIPLGSNCSLTPYAGIGFNWAAYGSFSDDYRYYNGYYNGYNSSYHSYYEPHEYQRFGNGAPKRWNNQLEFGGDLVINGFKIGFIYSKGIRDHELYKNYESYQNKIAITIGICVDDL